MLVPVCLVRRAADTHVMCWCIEGEAEEIMAAG